jgi:NADH:quinone reductase (non-electrogenic)
MNARRAAPGRHRVTVVGGGFGGLPAARHLGHKPVDVTLVDRRNHHLFQPLLNQVATGMLSPGQVAPPLRHILRRRKNVRVELAEVTGFDLERRIVHASSPADLHDIEITYDSLIVSGGATQSYFGHDELARYAPGMKSIDDALELRRRIFGAFEMAELAADETEKRRWLTIVIVGAGPTGVELAGQVRELAVRSLKGEFQTFDPASVRVLLLDGGTSPLATFGTGLSGKAATSLERLGVELRMGTRVTAVDVLGVDATGPDGTAIQIDAFTGFGNRLSTMLRWLRSMIGRDRAEREFSTAHTGGDLSLPGDVRAAVQPNLFPNAPAAKS